MSMRIGTAALARTTVKDIGERQAAIATAREEIASGKRINRPSDDPAAAARLTGIGSAVARLDQLGRNASSAESRLQLEETTIAAVSSGLTRVRDLTLQANNSSNGPVERAAFLSEIEQIETELIDLANTRDAGGDYLFSGSRTEVKPFEAGAPGTSVTYRGDDTARRVAIGIDRQVTTAATGSDVFMRMRDGDGNAQAMFDTVAKLADVLRIPGDANADDTARRAGMGAALASMDNALEHLNEARARSGTRLSSIDASREETAAVTLQMKATGASLEDADIVDVVTRLEREAFSLELLQKSYARMAGVSILDYL